MSKHSLFSVAALAAATLLLESTLTRLLAVAQFYHFAFLVVSLALLGFGASGALLSLAPRLAAASMARLLPWTGIAFAASAGLAYAVVNVLPFDSYSIAWERRQILFFALYYLALTLPFLCAGLAIGAALVAGSGRSHQVYAANLLGSGLGVLMAPVLLGVAGVPGAVLASALIALLPSLRPARPGVFDRAGSLAVGLALLMGVGLLAWLALLNLGASAPLGMTISPYKDLSQALRYPGSETRFGRWNAISRVDVVVNAGTRRLPGLSYVFDAPPPRQHGLSLDGDALQPITLTTPESFPAAAFLPEALAFSLKPQAQVLIVEPGSGLGVLQALAGGASQVTAVIDNPLVRQAVAHTSPVDVYAHPRVQPVLESGRTFLRRDAGTYDIVFLPLTHAYRPVTSGAYSLAESYSLTVEAFEAMLARLAPDGILAATRWLQTPPSEDLKLLATLVEALEGQGIGQPAQNLVAYRGIQTLTVLVRPGGWRAEDLAQVRSFLESRRYDLVWAPDIQPDETNRFNRMPAAEHYMAARQLLDSPDRQAFYAAYPFAVQPASDDQPFFFHFFRWGQAPEILAQLGHTWQPFGGSGYFILLALLALVVALSVLLILLPMAARRQAWSSDVSGPLRVKTLLYFALLGAAFLFVELPLIQRSILAFGHPTYAFTAVVLILLIFSGVGSWLARSLRLPQGVIMGSLALLTLLIAILGPRLVETALGWPAALRVLLTLATLSPLGLLMGLPFPLGLAWLEARQPDLVSWAWAINGCASVIAGVLAAIGALSLGFTAVLLLGAAAYGAAGLVMAFPESR